MAIQTVAEWYANTRMVGNIVIFLVIGIPVYLSLLTSVFGPPRNMRVIGTFLAMIAGGVVAFCLTLAVVGAVVSALVP